MFLPWIIKNIKDEMNHKLRIQVVSFLGEMINIKIVPVLKCT